MSESESFVKELAKRLNTFLEQDPKRANMVLATPMTHAGYAGVAHFLGELSVPVGTDAESMLDQYFLFPVIEGNMIKRFDVVTGQFLQDKSKTAVH